MPETPDLKALAERYLDLWEEQFAAAAADPALAAAMAAWLGPWRALAAETAKGGAAPSSDARRKTDERSARQSEKSHGGARAQAGAAPAAAAPGDGGSGLERILEQLQRIERRLDALEQQRGGERKHAGKGSGARAGARKGRSDSPD